MIDINKTGIWLQLDRYIDDLCIITEFQIPTDWLVNNIEITLDEFLNEYTSDESGELYALAQLDNVVLCEINR